MYSLPFDFDSAFAHSTCLMHWCWFEKPGNLLTPGPTNFLFSTGISHNVSEKELSLE